MNRKWIVLPAAMTVPLAACKPQAEPAAPAPAEPAAPAAAPVADAPPAPATFDAKAFAGTFSGTLPCAHCPGLATKFARAADGTYTVEETYQDRKVEPLKGDGTWTAEADGKRIRLDPNSKADQDRMFEVITNDEIRQLDIEGKPIESSLPYNLKREPAAK